MDEFLKELERFGDVTGAFSLLDIGLVLCLSFVLSLVVAAAYRYTHRGVSYSQSFVHTLVIMGTVVSLIMLIIGSNIARAFALVGALSIIRFRSAVKETRVVAFIFLAMAIGMAVGTRFYLLALFAAVVMSAFVVVLYKVQCQVLGLVGRAGGSAPGGGLLGRSEEESQAPRAAGSHQGAQRQPKSHPDPGPAGNRRIVVGRGYPPARFKCRIMPEWR